MCDGARSRPNCAPWPGGLPRSCAATACSSTPTRPPAHPGCPTWMAVPASASCSFSRAGAMKSVWKAPATASRTVMLREWMAGGERVSDAGAVQHVVRPGNSL